MAVRGEQWDRLLSLQLIRRVHRSWALSGVYGLCAFQTMHLKLKRTDIAASRMTVRIMKASMGFNGVDHCFSHSCSHLLCCRGDRHFKCLITLYLYSLTVNWLDYRRELRSSGLVSLISRFRRRKGASSTYLTCLVVASSERAKSCSTWGRRN